MMLSIIILNWNTKELLKDCLNSIVSSGVNDDWEIIIVDNGSTDGSVEYIKNKIENIKKSLQLRSGRAKKKLKIIFIRNIKNLGFAKGNNIGIKRAKGKYLLLLNSDTIVYPKTIQEMVNFMEKNQTVGAATCRVELADGDLDPACHRGFPTLWNSFCYFSGLERLFPKSKIFGGYHLLYLPMDKIHEIDSPTGAFYLVRKKVIEEVGLLDEDYFMYAEDLDWSYRIKKAGWKVMFYPFVKITHFKKRSGRKAKDKKTRQEINKYFYETMKLFYKKHYQDKYPKILLWLIFLMIDVKKFFANLF